MTEEGKALEGTDRLCPLCGDESEDYIWQSRASQLSRTELRQCLSCGFVFIRPPGLPENPVELFTRAYVGNERSGGMRDFYIKAWMRQDTDVTKVNSLKVLNSAHREVIALIRKEFPQGCTVFDIGCGAGYFMRAMKELNYVVFGLEVAQPMVEQLRRDGFPIWHGTIDSVPPGWVAPQVCTSFFMLHHLPDPVGFIRSVRKQFPESRLIVAEYENMGERNVVAISERSVAPRAYCWWGKRHLQLAMRKGGYNATAMAVTPRPREGGFSGAMSFYEVLRQHVPILARYLLALYYNTLPVWGWPRAVWLRWHKYHKYILAIGHPAE